VRDYRGDFAEFQQMLDDAGIDWNVGYFLSGLTRIEILGYIINIIELHKQGVDVYEFLPMEG